MKTRERTMWRHGWRLLICCAIYVVALYGIGLLILAKT